jgi:four helix bundle protein
MCNHFRIAYASAIETCDLLELLAELDLCGGEATADLIKRCDRSQKLLTGLLKRYGWLSYKQVRGEG